VRKISCITLSQQQTLLSITRYSFYLQNTCIQKTRLAQRNKPISQQSTLLSKMTDWTYSINHPWQQNKSYLYSEMFREFPSLCSAFSCTVNLMLCKLSAYRPSGSPTYTMSLNPLNAELNPICHFLALLGAHPILHVSRIRVKIHTAEHFYRYFKYIKWEKGAKNFATRSFIIFVQQILWRQSSQGG
jgi:hypothetical protein